MPDWAEATGGGNVLEKGWTLHERVMSAHQFMSRWPRRRQGLGTTRLATSLISSPWSPLPSWHPRDSGHDRRGAVNWVEPGSLQPVRHYSGFSSPVILNLKSPLLCFDLGGSAGQPAQCSILMEPDWAEVNSWWEASMEVGHGRQGFEYCPGAPSLDEARTQWP